MLPEQDDILFDGAEEIEEEDLTSRTYRFNYETMTIDGFIDEVEALKQAIACILQTERFECEIYSENYGVELVDAIGQPMEFTLIEIEENIKEALLEDDRILSVNNFEFEEKENGVHVTFEVESNFDVFESEVDFNV